MTAVDLDIDRVFTAGTAMIRKPKRLYEVRHDMDWEGRLQYYCGPAIISAITGRSAECAAAWINKIRDRNIYSQVKGTYSKEIAQVLFRLGYMMRSLDITRPGSDEKYTLRDWLSSRSSTQYDCVFALVVSDHWLVIHKDRLVCSRQPLGVNVYEAKKQKALVRDYYEITLVDDYCGRLIRKRRKDPLPGEE